MARNVWSLNGYKLYELTEKFIREQYGDEAADSANYGWAVDEVEGVICTKVYAGSELDWPVVVAIDTHGRITADDY